MYHSFADLSIGLIALNCARRTDTMSFGKGKAPAHLPVQYQENQWPPYPPADETELEKALRMEEEREAKRVSDAIDRMLESERQSSRRKQKAETRLLLLGVFHPSHTLQSARIG